MVIYDVYEELEKPDEREILFINRILDGKFGFSSYEEMEDIFHPNCSNKNDNYDVIIDEVSCENVFSLNMVEKFQLREEEYMYRYNQYLLCKENDVNIVIDIFEVSRLFAKDIKFLKRQENINQDSRTSPFQREEYDAGASNLFYLQYPTIAKQAHYKNHVHFGSNYKSPSTFGFISPWRMKIRFMNKVSIEDHEDLKCHYLSLYDIQVYN